MNKLIRHINKTELTFCIIEILVLLLTAIFILITTFIFVPIAVHAGLAIIN